MNRLGYRRIVLKSDGEPSLIAFTDTLARAWTGEVLPERSRKGESQSNGEVERAIQNLSAQVRTMKLALEARLGAEMADDTPIVSWLIEYASVLLRRHLVGADGRTAYESLKGRGDRRRLIECGEAVLYRQLKDSSHPPRPLDARFAEGVFLGIHDILGEILIGVGEHVVRGGEATRLSDNIRWDRDKVMAIRATAVQPNPGQEDLRIRTHIRDPVPPRAPVVAQPNEGNHDARQICLKNKISKATAAQGTPLGAPDVPRCAWA